MSLSHAALLDALLDAALVVDAEGTIMGVTPPLCDLLGRSEESLRGASLDDVVARTDAGATVAAADGPKRVEVITLGLLDGEARARLVIVREQPSALSPAQLAHFREAVHAINNALGAIRYQASSAAAEATGELHGGLLEIDAAAARAAELLRLAALQLRGGTVTATAPRPPDARPVVLLVDEDAQLRGITRRGLASRGLEVIEAANLAEARAVLESDCALDVVVSSVEAVVAVAQQARPALARLVTGPASVPGAAHLPKPFTASALASCIGGLLPGGRAP